VPLGHRPQIEQESLAQQGPSFTLGAAVENGWRGFWAEGIQHLHPVGMKWRTLPCPPPCNPWLPLCQVACDSIRSVAVMADLR